MKTTQQNTPAAFNMKETDLEVSSSIHNGVNGSVVVGQTLWFNLKYLVAGILFGIILVKSEVISWFRIQEMFRLQSFHMFGVIGSAVVTGIITVAIIKRWSVKTINGEPITFVNKKFHKGNIYGGLIFGIGWAITGTCPGPLFAQIGTGATVIIVTLGSAIAGTWLYGRIKEYLPH